MISGVDQRRQQVVEADNAGLGRRRNHAGRQPAVYRESARVGIAD